MPNRIADTAFWTFGTAAGLWFMVCVVYRIGGETRPEYFVGGIVGAGVLWGCGWLARAVLSGRRKPRLSTRYDAGPLASFGGGPRDRLRSKRSVKKIADRPNALSNARRHRRRRAVKAADG